LTAWVDRALDILGYLMVHPGASARELSVELGVPHPSAKKLLKRLVDGGYLDRRKLTFPIADRLAGSPPWLYLYYPTERARLLCGGVLPRIGEAGLVDPELDRKLFTAWWWRVHVQVTALSGLNEGGVEKFKESRLAKAKASSEDV